jgi:hypothetical protein
MTTAASPRHPWKALAVVLLVFAAVHGAGAHVFGDDDHASSHVRVMHVDHDHDCGTVRIDFDDDEDDDGPDEDALFDAFDDDDWS